MDRSIEERTIEIAKYVEQTGSTVRATAKVFSLSKSTVHNDLSKRLRRLDSVRYQRVHEILNKNFEEKHIRGGEATKRKYKEIEMEK